MVTTRRTRDEQAGHNRELVLESARTVFLEKGYHAATLDQIAEAAGFSKGVVYSQFESKADLFLALLERRIGERAAQNAAMLASIKPGEGLDALGRLSIERQQDAQWMLLLIEFRVVAARNPEINERYAALHQRTVDRLVELLGLWFEREGQAPPVALDTLVRFILALDPGMTLERAAHPGVLTADDVTPIITRIIGQPAAPANEQ